MIRQASSFVHNEKFPEMDELGLNPPVDPPPASPEIDALFELYRAVARGDDDIVRSMVSEGRPLSKLNSLKASPVLLSVWNNDPRMLSMLLESGADGSSIDRKSGFAPLHHAAMCEGAAECIKLLVRHGASLLCRTTRGGYTPLFLACVLGITDNVATLLALALKRVPNDASLHGSVFIESNKTPLGHTCLVAAVRTGNCRLVSLLVYCGASVKAADPGGVTPVEAADDRDDMIEALIGRSSLQRRLLDRSLSAPLGGDLYRFEAPSAPVPQRVLKTPSPLSRAGGFSSAVIRRDGRGGYSRSMSSEEMTDVARMRRVQVLARRNMRLMEQNMVSPPVGVCASVRRYERLLREERSLEARKLLGSHLGESPEEVVDDLRKILVEKQKICLRQAVDGIDLLRWCSC